MKSMTGYAVGELQNETVALAVELKGYNNRYLDIQLNLPPYLGAIEQELRSMVTELVARGRVELTVRVRELAPDLAVRVDEGNAKQYAGALRSLASAAGLLPEFRLAELLQFDGLFHVERKRDAEFYLEQVRPVLVKALEEFDESRKREGQAMAADLRRQIERIEGAVDQIENQVPRLQEEIQTTVLGRFRELLGDALDENRAYSEVAALLVRYSINEELARLRSHVAGFTQTLDNGGVLGKKLDFVCQELNREVNTIASKSYLTEVSQRTIEIKDAIENLREQVRNLE